jgi:tRNA A-37 threonylcarbamoyl transferase component Bud32
MLSDRYELGDTLGAGVSATVYRAFDTRTRSVVAVKVLNPHLRTDAVSLERFRREIRIARALGHPQVVSIYDLVVEPEATYLVMECVEGLSLHERLALDGPLPLETALGLLRQLLDVLAACHARGIVHRDLKPQNVMLRPDGLVKVLDFGIARMTMLADLTQTGTSLGSPEYMAPELFAASAWDPRSDLYALGVMLFELLTGELPFVADSLPLLYRRHLTAPVPSIPDAPRWLGHLVERLLAKAPHERYQSAEEVLDDLDARRVLARELPALARRECVRCGDATLAELPVCTRCGHDVEAALGRGMWDVACTEATDRDALAAWLREAFGERAPRVGRRAELLLAGIDRPAAELFRQGALRRGVILSVARRSPFTLARKLFSFVGLVGALWVAGGSLWYSEAEYSYLPPHVAFLVVYGRGIGAALVAWVCFQLFRRAAIRPAFGRGNTARAYVATEFPWVRELVPNGCVPRDATQAFLASLVEKRLLFARHVPGLDAGTRATLDRLLVSACRVAHLVADVECTRAAAPRATAETLLGVEDAQASLLRKLVRLQAVFNRLLGRAIVLRLPLDDADATALEECARDLATELEATRQAGAELRRVA